MVKAVITSAVSRVEEETLRFNTAEQNMVLDGLERLEYLTITAYKEVGNRGRMSTSIYN